jgi:hypothetical protein
MVSPTKNASRLYALLYIAFISFLFHSDVFYWSFYLYEISRKLITTTGVSTEPIHSY